MQYNDNACVNPIEPNHYECYNKNKLCWELLTIYITRPIDKLKFMEK